MIIGAYLCVLGAIVSWLTAVVSMVELITRHRHPDRPVAWYFVSGMAGLNPDNFAPSGARAHARAMVAVGCFFLFAMLGFVFGVVADAG